VYVRVSESRGQFLDVWRKGLEALFVVSIVRYVAESIRKSISDPVACTRVVFPLILRREKNCHSAMSYVTDDAIAN